MAYLPDKLFVGGCAIDDPSYTSGTMYCRPYVTALDVTNDLAIDPHMNFVLSPGEPYYEKHIVIDQMVADRALNKVWAVASAYEEDMSSTVDYEAGGHSYYIIEILNEQNAMGAAALLEERYELMDIPASGGSSR